MTKRQQTMRRARVVRMTRVLKRLYPDARIALHYRTDFECLVAVQLSAQCTDERVNATTPLLFKTYKTVNDYADATQRDIERIIYSCGFYKNKAKNIIGAAKMIRDVYDGKVPQTLAELLCIPGVARKTANVVLATLYGIAEGIAVDTHIRRFAIRFALTDYTDPVRIERDLMAVVPEKDWWAFTHRLVHYGRDVCPARPHMCEHHPLTKIYPKSAKIWPKSGTAALRHSV